MRFPIGLFISVLIGLPFSAEAKTGTYCARFLAPLKVFVTPDRESLLNRYSKLSAEDDRLAVLYLTKFSATLNAVESAVSPGIVKEVLLKGRKTPTELPALLSLIRSRPSILNAKEASESPWMKVILDLELRFRLAVTMYLLSTNEDTKGIEQDYPSALIQFLKRSAMEIDQNGIQIDLIELVNRLDVLQTDESYFSPIFASTERISTEFKIPFTNNLLEDVLKFGRRLDDELTNVTVGISLRPIEAVSSVRYGQNHYFGNYYNYKQISRKAYERSRPNIKGSGLKVTNGQGTIHIELNLSNRKKKMVAILLDQTHCTLDPAFKLGSVPNRMVHTCGTYPNYIFLRSGVPVISPSYIWPEPGIASLIVQRILNLPTVKRVEFANFGATGAVGGVVASYWHGFMGAQHIEVPIYLWLLSQIADPQWLSWLM